MRLLVRHDVPNCDQRAHGVGPIVLPVHSSDVCGKERLVREAVVKTEGQGGSPFLGVVIVGPQILGGENVRVSEVRHRVKAVLNFRGNRVEARRRDDVTGKWSATAHWVLDDRRRRQSRKIPATPCRKGYGRISHHHVRGTKPLELQAGEEECLVAAVVDLRDVYRSADQATRNVLDGACAHEGEGVARDESRRYIVIERQAVDLVAATFGHYGLGTDGTVFRGVARDVHAHFLIALHAQTQSASPQTA